MGSYQPANGEITGSVAPHRRRHRHGPGRRHAVIVAPGETLEMIARRHHVPVSAIMQANNITNPATVHPGQHLVIPRYRAPAPVAYAPPATRIATVPGAVPVGAPRIALAPAAGVHIVAPGETLEQYRAALRQTGHSAGQGQHISRLTPWSGWASASSFPSDSRARSRALNAAPPPPIRDVEPPSENRRTAPGKRRLLSRRQRSRARSKTAEPVGSLPSFRWPVRGRVIAGFGPSPNGLQNDGIDVSVPQGTPVKAADDGVVAYAGNELKGYGNLVLIRHSNGYVTAYAHASEILVKRGETVKRGQVIAKAGETGNVKTPELHFEIRKGATPVDPAQFLNGA